MIIQPLRRSLLQASTSNNNLLLLPPTLHLPHRALLSTITHTTNPSPLNHAYHPTTPSTQNQLTQNSQPSPSPPPPPPPQLSRSSPLPPPTTTSLTLLPLLAAQTPHYLTAHIHARPYLLTLGDTLRLPFLMPNAPVGCTLRLTRVSTIGSRDYTYRGAPWVDERAFVCRVRVVGVESEPMRTIEKTKRRQRHVKTVRSKGRFTVVRVCEVLVRAGVEEGENVNDGKVEEREEMGDGKLVEDDGRVRRVVGRRVWRLVGEKEKEREEI